MFLACALAVWASAGVAASPAAQADGTYVALGDSVADPLNSYVDRLYGFLRTPEGGGFDTLYNRAVTGESSTSLRTGSQLATAIADIDGPSDTKLVTIDIGGNDRGVCGPPPTWHLPSCPFAANFDATLADLQLALARDPGPEPLIAMTYYNPASGTGTTQEQDYDRGLLGSDLRIECAPGGDPRLGLNDQITCISGSRAARVADVYPAFKAGGQALMGDEFHPNADGQAVIAGEFCKAGGWPPPSGCPATSGWPPRVPAPPPYVHNNPLLLEVLTGRRQRPLRNRGVIVRVRCDNEPCSYRVYGRLDLRRRGRKIGLRQRLGELPADRTARLRLRFSKPSARTLRSALLRGRRVRARVIVRVRDRAGNLAQSSRLVRLIR